MNIIDEIEKEQMERELPEFTPGDTVRVNVRIQEGGKERPSCTTSANEGAKPPESRRFGRHLVRLCSASPEGLAG